MATENAEVVSYSSFEVVLPCVPRENSHPDKVNESDNDSGVENPAQHAVVCSLAIGNFIEPAVNVEYKAVLIDADGVHESSAADWKLSKVNSYSTTEQGSPWQEPSSMVVFDFTLMKNDSLDHTLLQFITPSILTSLAATGVFSLPPLAGERIPMAGLAFLGQLVLAGFSVIAQVQSDDYYKLRNFMTFSTVYVFLVVMAVLVRFFVSPFLKRAIAVKHETGDMENDEAKLISITVSWLASFICTSKVINTCLKLFTRKSYFIYREILVLLSVSVTMVPAFCVPFRRLQFTKWVENAFKLTWA